MSDNQSKPDGIIAGIVRKFLSSQLSIILIIASLCLGAAAILVTPREEEPQIVVPMADIYVRAPGANRPFDGNANIKEFFRVDTRMPRTPRTKQSQIPNPGNALLAKKTKSVSSLPYA